MITLNEKYITDSKGNKTAVIIDIKDYEKLLKALNEYEEYDSQNVNYDIAKGLKDVADNNFVPFSEFFGDISSYFL